LGDEIVLRDWLVYYIQAVLFVKVFVRPICNFLVTFLSDNSLVFAPVFWGESELYSFAVFCQGLFATNFRIRFQARFLVAVRDSEGVLYAPVQKSQGV
jgi:hypothetical protein